MAVCAQRKRILQVMDDTRGQSALSAKECAGVVSRKVFARIVYFKNAIGGGLRYRTNALIHTVFAASGGCLPSAVRNAQML